MSVKNHKNLIVVAGVVAALLAGTVLLGGYAKSVPAKSDTSSQVQAKGGCPMMSAYLAESGEVSCPHLAKAGFNAEACPMGRTEPCCAEDPPQDCCGTPCPPGCPKPCCAQEASAGCCADAADAAGACCPTVADTATQ
jgi:hypothetical protein